MADTVLFFTHSALLLIFGVFLSAAFSGITLSRKNCLYHLIFCLLCGGSQLTLLLLSSEQTVWYAYPAITHLEAQNKQILIHTSDSNVLTVTTPLHQLAPQLDDPCFYQCHRSYIINMNYIRSLSKTELTMSDGAIIPISRNCSKELHSTYFEFLFGKAGDL